MEQKRLIIAIALSFIVIFVWQLIFSTPQKQDIPENQPVETQDTDVKDTAQKEDTVEQANQKEDEIHKEPAIQTADMKNARIIKIHTPLYIASISEKGGQLKSFILNNYKESNEKDSRLKELISPDSEGTLTLGLEEKSLSGLEKGVFLGEVDSEEIHVTEDTLEIPFTWTSAGGVVVQKIFTFKKDSYLIGFDIKVINQTKKVFRDQLVLTLHQKLGEPKGRVGHEGISAYINEKLEQIDKGDIEDKALYDGKITWMAIQDRYFMTSIVSTEENPAKMRAKYADVGIFDVEYIQEKKYIEAGQTGQYHWDMYFGPRSLKILKNFNNKLEKSVNFGFFDILSKPCLKLMNFIYSLIPNYGIAIIILTLIIKIIFWPLGSKSYKSMNAMKKLQPLMTEIRQKYKHDKKRMNEEVMALYRTYKINPLGGCLPMVVQIPVFFGLYRMLYEAIELRHTPFFLWITDLSAPDRLFHFPFDIPYMTPPTGIPVLTIIMGASMLLQQKMSPPMGDPTQAKMMMLMPIVFTVIFVNFSSGLVLYWLVNNVLSIGQQYYVMKRAA